MCTAGKIAKSMGNLAVETTSVAQCMRLYRALGDQTGVWVQFGGRRLRLVELEEMEDEEETLAAQDSSKKPGALQYLRDFKEIALCLKVRPLSVSLYILVLVPPYFRTMLCVF